MAGRGRGMASNQGHPGGPGVGMGGQGYAPGGDERRELRRPIVGQPGPNPEDITRGMAKMEPYREEHGRFGGFAGPHGGGQPGGQQAMGPPRPAPNADGWSSGENQFGQQQYQGQWNTGSGMNPMLQQNLNGAHQQFAAQQHARFASQVGQQNFEGQQNMNAQNNPNAWAMNIGASEFVPKNTNLSVQAQEFVPRHIPQNNSFWAQQQQQQQQQQQAMLYQQQNQFGADQNSAYPQPEPNYDPSGMQQPDYNQIPSNTQQQQQQQQQQQPRHQGYQGNSGGGYKSSASVANPSSSSGEEVGGGYDPREMLSDAVATLVFMPTKFDRTVFTLTEKFNFSVHDVNTLTSLVGNLVDTCLSEKNFRSMAGRFCDYLANKCRLDFDGITFRSLLLEKYQAIHSNHTSLISNDPDKFRSLVIFGTDLYLRFLGKDSSVASDETQDDAEPKPEIRKRQPEVADLLYTLYRSALTIGKEDTMNLTTVVDMLKLVGKSLEEDEKEANDESSKQLQNLMDAIYLMSKNETDGCQYPANLRKLLAQLIEIRAAKWHIEESDRPTVFDIPEARGPAASTNLASGKRSNAIKICKPPSGYTEPPEPRTNRGNHQNGKMGHQQNNKSSAQLPPDTPELTEAELRFMSEQMGDTDSECMTAGGESDIGSVDGMMPEDVEAAYQQFLDEQQKASEKEKS